jgi:hypothetical protein
MVGASVQIYSCLWSVDPDYQDLKYPIEVRQTTGAELKKSGVFSFAHIHE